MNLLEQIDSYYSDWNYGHPRILYSLMRSLKPKVSVEVGTYRGYAACYMAAAIKSNGHGKLYCIDDFSESTQKPCDWREWLKNMRVFGFDDYAKLLVGRSDAVEWPEAVDFAYIDGWHSFEVCSADFERCSSLGASLIALDDIDAVGPRMVMQNARKAGWDVLELYSDHGLALCSRTHVRAPVTFSQELPGSPGVRLDSKDELERHLSEASKITGLTYELSD